MAASTLQPSHDLHANAYWRLNVCFEGSRSCKFHCAACYTGLALASCLTVLLSLRFSIFIAYCEHTARRGDNATVCMQ